MSNNFSPDLITLLDDSGFEHSFEILDTYEENGKLYYALMPVYENKEDMLYDTGEYTILEVIDGDEELAEIDDDELRIRLSGIFEERFNDSFYND